MARNNKGFTLIEILIAMIILMVGMLALLNTAAVVIENNLTNILRDEAVRIGEEKMSDLKNTPFDNLDAYPTAGTATRSFRSFTKTYTITTTVSAIAGMTDARNLQVNVSWTHKGNNFQHNITSIVNR